MNPLTNVRNLNKINERELASGTAGDDRRSWHTKYKDSAWVFAGGLPYDLSEGDIICIFSQYGEIVNVNLIRDKKTGKSRGFCFVCYEDQRSTVLAVDNFNGTTVLGRTLRVDHVENYRVPKDRDDLDDETRKLFMEGCAPEIAATSEERRDKSEEKIEAKRKEEKNGQQPPDEKRRERKDEKKERKREDEKRGEKRRKEKKEKRHKDEKRNEKRYKDDKKSEKRRRSK